MADLRSAVSTLVQVSNQNTTEMADLRSAVSSLVQIANQHQEKF